MKIAALLPHVEIFGGVRRYLELGNEFVRRGHQFILYTPEGVPPSWLEFNGEIRPILSASKENHDIALCSEYSLLSDFLPLPAKVKFFYFVLAGHPLEKKVARLPLQFLANSSGLARRLTRRYGIRCQLAPGGINPTLFHPEAREGSKEEFRILCYGRIYRRRKGIHLVIKAAERLWRKYPNIKLLLFDSPVKNEARDPRKLLKTSVPNEFFWDLPQSKMAWLYSQADLFVSAEWRAGWSNPTAEAMACGVPVVCTPSGTEDFAIPGETALVVRWPLPIFLARKIEQLKKNESLRKRLAEAGRQKILEFTWEATAARLEEIFVHSLV
ncbi:MAG: glycosyltransferase family 4 protein [Candidatus Aminicenantes bacterium]|nr:glycosyltransferase family 4 protein [Candidatus Aminicenantes bacterium]